MNVLKKIRNATCAVLACAGFLVASCTEEQSKDYPVPLDNPLAETIAFDGSTDRSKIRVSWPQSVVDEAEGAKGFVFSLYKVDEDGGIILETVGEENEGVSANFVERSQEPETYYKAVLRLWGDGSRSNAQLPIEIFWNNFPVTLTPPAQGDVQVVQQGLTWTISWSPVQGASGYRFTLFEIDGFGEKLKVIGQENQELGKDATSVTRTLEEEITYYLIELTAVGSPDAWPATLSETGIYHNAPATTIATGTNLTQYFTTNPVSGGEEAFFLLEANGTYTMTGNIETGATSFTLRGQSKEEPSKISVTDGSFVNGGAGLILENLEMDYSNFATVDNLGGDNLGKNAVILMNSVQQGGLTLVNIGDNAYALVPASQPIVLQSCKITGLKGYLVYDSNQRYAIETLLIDDCVIGMNTGTWGNATLRFQISLVKDFTITESTVYNEIVPSNSNNRFMQFNHNNYASQITGWTGGTMTVTNCTFWQAGKSAQAFNSNNAMGRPEDLVTIQKNVFVDSYENGRIISRFRRGNTNAQYVGGQNTQWYDGANFTGSQDLTADPVDRIDTNPGLTYSGNGVFTMSGADQQAAHTGDPRWLK
ncbi:MAG: DUF4957 domain-containing protein [Tannerella sp.]|jgi:hypothetical protein|nr:DUF4957 domain-containing protein [Tannerella sp.]